MKRLLAAMLCLLLLCACAGRTSAPEPAPTASAGPVLIGAAETASPGAPASDALSVLFINVGYGDAALICCQGRAMLIDTGAKAAVPQVFAALSYMGVTALDAVALTHTHGDHIGGLEAIARSLPVGRVYAAVFSENKKNGENKITVLSSKLALPLTRLSAGDALPLTDGLGLEVLGPVAFNAEDDNDNSLVLRLTYGGSTFLFTGDMQFAEEATLLDAGVPLKADILKVGNHGNPDATGDAFGAAVAPRLAVISTSTAEDDDSANPRVRTALPDADVRVTEDFPLGVLVTVDAAGGVTVSSPEFLKSVATLSVSLDIPSQLVTVANTGADEADLTGFVLLSERGGECFRFPAGVRLSAGASLTVSATGGGGDYAFADENSPWNQKKGDTALLYDAGGHLMAQAEG